MNTTDPIMLSHLVESVDDLKFDTYWDVIKYNSQVVNFSLWMECARQWLILTCTIGFSVLFLHSIYNLKRTQQGIDFDQVILIIELTKVSIS